MLAVEAGAEDLWAYGLARRRLPAAVAAHVGRALGLLHRGTRLPDPRAAPDRAPYALSLHRPRLDDLRALSPGSIDLVKALQAHGTIGERLDALRLGWREEALVHFDVKWPNVLVVPAADGRPGSIRLVDWEQAGDGDPAWDVGSAFAAFVSFWLYSIPRPTTGRTPGDLASSARVPLGEMRGAIRACWESYLTAAQIATAPAEDLLRRAVGLCAARLVRTASEESQIRTTLDARSALHLQVAANVLDDPDAAAARLLGLDLGSASRE